MNKMIENHIGSLSESAVEEAGVTDSAQPASWPGSFSATDSDTMTLVVEERRSSRWRVEDTFLSQCCMKVPAVSLHSCLRQLRPIDLTLADSRSPKPAKLYIAVFFFFFFGCWVGGGGGNLITVFKVRRA